MTYVSPYGVPEGLERRLAAWANSLSRDKKYPWAGTGLIDDLKLASKTLGAEDFDKLYPPEFIQTMDEKITRIMDPEPEEDEFAHFQSSPPDDVEPEEDEFAHFQPSPPEEFDL